jgi:hypothetical protein
MRKLVIAFAVAVAAAAHPARGASAQGIGDAEKLVELIESVARDAAGSGPSRLLSAATEEDLAALRRMWPVLERRRVSLRFEKTPLADAAEFFAEVSGFNVVLSAKAREKAAAEGLEVTLRLNDVSLRNALELALIGTDGELAYGVKHGVLWIGLAEEWQAPEAAILDIYDVIDLIHQPPDFPAPRLGLEGLKLPD